MARQPGTVFCVVRGVKAILAHIVLVYDMKLGGTGLLPANIDTARPSCPRWPGMTTFNKRATSVRPDA